MYRQHLLGMLAAYGELHVGERDTVARMQEFVAGHKDCFLRSCRRGHVTASAWIVSHDARRFLLAHHRKLDRWLQLGGHADGEPEVHRVALREACEESGIDEFELHRPDGEVRPLDVDIHEIPAHGRDPAHLHYDVRFLLRAPAEARLRVSDESHDLRWFGADELDRVAGEESLRRMARKARALI